MPPTSEHDGSGVSPGDGLEEAAGCLFCGSDKGVPVITGARDLFFGADPGEFTFHRCADCGSLWLPVRPAGDRLLRAYSGYYTHAEPPREGSHGLLRGAARMLYIRARYAAPANLAERLVLPLVRRILPGKLGIDLRYRLAPRAPARLLDYGCGNGDYLLRMEPLGHALCGAEFDPHLLDGLAGRGIAIAHVADLEAKGWAGTFDHVTLSHVLEHVPDPVELLARLFTMLRPGGTLFVEVPNAGATGLAIFGAHWRGLEVPRHFALPSRTALVAALERAGFQIETQHVDPIPRRWVWDESINAMPSEERASAAAAIRAAPPETAETAEFLTFLARRPG